MIRTNELRIGNLVRWNPKLMHPTATLSAMPVEVTAILKNKIGYTFPNLDHRVEAFEDDLIQETAKYKDVEELEPIFLSAETVEKCGFSKRANDHSFLAPDKTLYSLHFSNTGSSILNIQANEQVLSTNVQCLHHLQNIIFETSRHELSFI